MTLFASYASGVFLLIVRIISNYKLVKLSLDQNNTTAVLLQIIGFSCCTEEKNKID